MSGPNPKNLKAYGVLTLGAAGVILSATAVPTPKTLAKLIGLGLPDLAARSLLHVGPVILLVTAILAGRALARGRSRNVRWSIYALAGGVTGFFTAFCLDLFAGVPVLITALNGPLSEPGLVEICLWSLGGMSIFMAVMITSLAIFGTPAAQALQVEEDVDPECMEVRQVERASYGMSGVGMFTLGIACIALAVARQAGEGAVIAPVVIAALAGAVSALASYLLWRGFDELQRRQVINGYATSAIVGTLGAFGWALADVLKILPPLDAGAMFVVLTLVQLVAVTVVTSAALGQSPAPRRLA